MTRRPAPTHAYEPFSREALDGTIPGRFERIAARHADRPAIEDGGRTWLYGQLAATAERIAGRVFDVSGPRDDPPRPVAILLDQGAAFVSALLGVLRAGSFPVPLDPRNPPTRNRAILEDSRARVVVGDSATLDSALDLVDGRIGVDLDDPSNPPPAPPMPHDPDALATLLYTSGSTGRPKGVMQTHRNVLHNTLRHTNEFRIVPADRFTLLYPCGVYGGVRDVFNALLNGACLCRYPLEVDGLVPLGDWMIDRRITIYCSVATLFRQLAPTLGKRRFPDLRLMKLGGEVVYRSDFEAFRRHFEPGALLSCGLAATEVGAVRQVFLDHASEIDSTRLPCGFPVEDVEIRIEDEDRQELPVGRTGEIVVRSRYLSPGYWMRPQRTASVFATDPDDPAVRRYRTGDLGLLREDGQLIHAGRKDHQVKIRGNRVEIPEIEATLLELEGVREAAVVAREDPERGNLLDGFVVADADGFDETALRAGLAARLPAFMVPSRIVRLDRIPLLPNAKIDRVALERAASRPAPTAARAEDSRLPSAVREMATIWQELLDRPIALDEGFFDAGGDSLALLQLMVRIEQRFGVRLELNAILDAPTIEALAARVERERSGSSATVEPIADRPRDAVALGVVPIQPRGDRVPLLFVAPAGGSVLAYYRLAHLLGPDQPFYGLQVHPPRRRGTPLDVPRVAERFLDLVRPLCPSGVCRVGGWSFGGFVAWEIAALSRTVSLDVRAVMIVDSDATLAGGHPGGLGKLHGLRMLVQMMWHGQFFMRNRLFFRLAAQMRRDGTEQPAGLLRRLVWRAGLEHDSLSEVVASDPRLLDLQPVPGGRMRSMRAYIRAIRDYRPPTLDVPVDLFLPDVDCGRRERARATATAARWDDLTSRGLRVHSLPGNHFTLFQPPHVRAMAESMRAAMDENPYDTTADRVHG